MQKAQEAYKKWISIRFRILPILNTISFIPVIVITILAAIGKLGGSGSAIDVLKSNFSMITPKEYTLSIVIVLYILCGILCLFQLIHLILWLIVIVPVVGRFGGDNALMFERLGPWFLAINLLNLGWTFAWIYEQFWISFAIMFVMFILLLIVYFSIGITYGNQLRNVNDYNSPEDALIRPSSNIKKRSRTIYMWEYFVIQFPFSMYLACTTFALILNFTIAWRLQFSSSNPNLMRFYWTEEGWACVIQTLICVIATVATITRKDFVFSATLAFILYGIAVRAEMGPRSSQIVMTAGYINASLTTLLTLYSIIYCIVMLISRHVKYQQNVIKL